MAKNKFNKSWMHSHLGDPYVKQAQKEGYRSRAAYKLKEIDDSNNLIQPGQIIVDLGASPGSWSQYVQRKWGKDESGTLISLDLLPMETIQGVHFLQGDFREESILHQLEELLAGRKADIVLSDMAPNLSGIAVTDAARMEHLLELALEFAQTHLKPSGVLLVKCFNGIGYNEIIEKFRQHFKIVTAKKPKASRDQSSEVYLIGKVLRNESQ